MTQNQDFATGFLVTFFFFPINKTAVITSSVRDDIIIRSHFLLAHETSRDFKLPHVFFFFTVCSLGNVLAVVLFCAAVLHRGYCSHRVCTTCSSAVSKKLSVTMVTNTRVSERNFCCFFFKKKERKGMTSRLHQR